MASNNKFNDVAVGYRPQTAFPLNANEYFESMAAATKAAATAAEVGTAEANRTSYYVGQVLTVYETFRPMVSAPVTTNLDFARIAQDAVDRNIPVVLVTIKGSVETPASDDEKSSTLAQWLKSDEWRQYAGDNLSRFYLVYGQTGVDPAVWDSVTSPQPGLDPLAAWYSQDDWGEYHNSFAKIGVVCGDSVKQFWSVEDIQDANDLVSAVDGAIGSADRDETVSLHQVQPDGTLKPVGSGSGSVMVDDVTIRKNADGKICVKALPSGVVDNNTIKMTSGGKLYLSYVPKSYLAGYVETSALTGYVETPGARNYRIQTDHSGKAFVYVPWEKGEGGGGGGSGAVSVDVIVDNVTIGKKPDQTIYVKSVPDRLVQNPCVLFKDWTVPPLGKIRLLSRGGGWQYYAYPDISAEQGDAKSLVYMENENVAAPFSSNEFLQNPENLIALDFGDARVLSIGSGAFKRCEALSGVDCRAVLSVGEYAFAECTSLTEAKFPDAERIQAGAFYAAEALSAIECPFVYDIGDFALSGCGQLVSIACHSLQTVGRAAFESCVALTSIDCRDVIQAGPGAFSGCSSLKSVSMYRLSALDSGVFSGCAGLTSVFAPSVSGQIQPSAFANCSSLSGIGVWNATGVGVSAFAGCQALSGIRSDDIAKIGKYAFADCVSISSMNLPSVKIIDESAFEGCGVMSVILSGAADEDGIPAVYGNSFDGIPQTVSVYVLGGMKEEFEADPTWAGLENAESDGHKKILICELDIGGGEGTRYTDADGNPLDDLTLLRDIDDSALRDLT